MAFSEKGVIMTVQELIFSNDMEKILDACCAILPETIDVDRYRPRLAEYLESFRYATPQISDNLIVSRLVNDFDGEQYYDACSVHEFDTEKLTESYNRVQELRKDMDKAYHIFNTDHDAWSDMFHTPIQYAFEFTPTIEILGYQAAIQFKNEDEKYKAIAAIIDEMTFFGFDEQEKEDKLNQVEETANEVEEILKLPEEEQEKYFGTITDLFPEMEVTPLTEEEKIEIRRQLVTELFWNIEYMYNLLCATPQNK